MLYFSPFRFGPIAKRTFDLAVAILLGAFSLPLIALMALCIRLESPGNPFFVQTRVGRHGKTFRMIKMRTLYSDRFGLDLTRELSLHDARITPVGRWLRRSKIDELPQLINVIVGHMSLIGPRPDIPEQVITYTPSQKKRLLLRPGMTGAAQICGNTALGWAQRIQIDRWYIQHWSWRLDVKIMGITLWAIWAGETQAANRLQLPLKIFQHPAPPLIASHATVSSAPAAAAKWVS